MYASTLASITVRVGGEAQPVDPIAAWRTVTLPKPLLEPAVARTDACLPLWHSVHGASAALPGAHGDVERGDAGEATRADRWGHNHLRRLF